jgi:hypothetical protein
MQPRNAQWLLVEGGTSVEDMYGPQDLALWGMLKLEDADNAEPSFLP